MKREILTVLILAFTFTGFSQNLGLSWHGGAIINGDYIDVSGSVDSMLLFEAKIHNIGVAAVEVKVRKEEINIIPGSDNVFCFAGSCYTSQVSVTSAQLAVGGSDSSFAADYYAYGNQGTSIIRYTFFNTHETTDTISVYVRFTGSLGIDAPQNPDFTLLNVYPNPANDRVFFDYHNKYYDPTNTVLIVRDFAGRIVKEHIVSAGQGTLVLDVSDIDNGVYFYSFTHNQNITLTRKLIIKR